MPKVTLTSNIFHEGHYHPEGSVLDVTDEQAKSLVDSELAFEGAESEGAANAPAPLPAGSQVAGDSPAPVEQTVPTEPTQPTLENVTPPAPEVSTTPEATQIPVTEPAPSAPSTPSEQQPQVTVTPPAPGQPSADEISDTLKSIQ